MEKSKGMLSTQTTLKVFRAIESGIGLKAVAESMGLSVKQVRTINNKTASDIEAVRSFLQTASVAQRKRMRYVVQFCDGNELSSQRRRTGLSRQTLRRWILAAELGLLAIPAETTVTMSKNKDKKASRSELEARIKDLEERNLLLRAECDYLKKKEEIEQRLEEELAERRGRPKS